MTAPVSEFEGFEQARAIARRRRMRIALPIAVVTVMLLALVGIAAYDYKMMRADALALSKGVIINLQSRIETEIAAFLRPIPGIIRLSRDLIADKLAAGIPRDRAEPLGIGMLQNAPQLTSLIIGNRNGEFLMVHRVKDADEEGMETKIIHRDSGSEDGFAINLTRRRSDGTIVSSKQESWDGYDPRKRPWYRGAEEHRSLHWTDVYPFFTSRAAGITGSVPYVDEEKRLLAVVGVDVTLDSISRFLATLTIGKTGLALIIDDQGRVIAHPKAELLQEGTKGQLRLTQVVDLKNAVISRAFDRYRVEGHGRRDFDLDGRRYISSVSSLNHLLQRDWSILVVVPEDDFVGFVVDNVSKTLVMGLGVIALAALLAGLLIRQGLRADRDATNILERQAQLDAQSDAFGKLAGQSALFETQDSDALTPVTEAVTQAARVSRTSIWHFNHDANILLCIDCFDLETEGHTQGARLSRLEHPGLFEALSDGEILTDIDATSDARLSSLYHNYLTPLGCRAFVSLPILAREQVTGALWLEDRSVRSKWPNYTMSFAQAIANLLAIRNATGDGLQTAPAADVNSVQSSDVDIASALTVKPQPAFKPDDLDTSLGVRRAAAFTAKLAARAGAEGSPRAGVIERLPVMALRFTDAMALAEPIDEMTEETTIGFLVRELETTATTYEISYLKFLSDQVIASIDPGEDIERGLERITAFALDVQGICERLLAEHHSPLSFRIGLDLGPVIGSLVGRDRRSFNFWGEAVQLASTMADTSLPGAIQVTESVYHQLNGQFLFQLRGHHYLEGLGVFSTYLLSGRL